MDTYDFSLRVPGADSMTYQDVFRAFGSELSVFVPSAGSYLFANVEPFALGVFTEESVGIGTDPPEKYEWYVKAYFDVVKNGSVPSYPSSPTKSFSLNVSRIINTSESEFGMTPCRFWF